MGHSEYRETRRVERSTGRATMAPHGVLLSRLGGQLVLWSSSELRFACAPHAFGGVSSIMPQKRDSDAAALLASHADA